MVLRLHLVLRISTTITTSFEYSDNTSQVSSMTGNRLGGGLFTFSKITDDNVITDEAGTGAAVADFDNDSDLDWFVAVFPMTPAPVPAIDSAETPGTASCLTVRMIRRPNRVLGLGHVARRISTTTATSIFFTSTVLVEMRVHYSLNPSRLFIANGDGSFTEYSEPLGLVEPETGTRRRVL